MATPTCDMNDLKQQQQPLLLPHRVNIINEPQPLVINGSYYGSNDVKINDTLESFECEESTARKNTDINRISPLHLQGDGTTSIDDSVSLRKGVRFMEESYNSFWNGSVGTVLNYEQATTLMITMDNTRNVIENYLQTLGQYQGRSTPAPRRKSWWGLHCWPQKRKWLYRYITIVTIALQFMNLLILSLLDAWPKPKEEYPYILASSVTMIILQLINLFFLILASGRLVKQIYRNSVNSVFLAQTYGATILLFAGLYTLTYRLQRHSWRFVNENLYEDPIQVFVLYAKFLFYSISTATLCGSDNVLPEQWFNCLFAGFQMLLSFCYFASILGSAMCHDNTRLPTPARNVSSSVPAQKHATPTDSNSNHQCHQNPYRHHLHPQNRVECQSFGKENGDQTIVHQTITSHSNGHLPNRHNFTCCNGSALPAATNACPSHQLNIQHPNEQCCIKNSNCDCDDFGEIGETNPVFSIEMPRSATLGCRNGKSSLKHPQKQVAEVEVLNSHHIRVDH